MSWDIDVSRHGHWCSNTAIRFGSPDLSEKAARSFGRYASRERALDDRDRRYALQELAPTPCCRNVGIAARPATDPNDG
jgi:hypothetical protein